MPKEQSVLKRLLVRARPQFLEDWLGTAGSLFSKGTMKLFEYNRRHARLGERVEQAPDLIWKAAEGAATAQHAKAEADYAKAENDRMEAELRRRTMEADSRRKCAEADRAEAEAGTAKIREIQARLELLKQLNDAGVSVTMDSDFKIVVANAESKRPLNAAEILETDEQALIKPNLIEVQCPWLQGFGPFEELTLTKWRVSTGTHIVEGEILAIVALSTSPESNVAIPATSTGVIKDIFIAENSVVNPGQVIVSILADPEASR